MTDDEIKAKIVEFYQIELNNLGNTDTLADIVEDNGPDGGGPDYDRASYLVQDAQIQIVWGAA